MKMLDKRTTGDLVKLVIFIVVTSLATGVLIAVIGNLTFAGSNDYKAEFVDATGVVKGDDVRIAGVKVGTVQEHRHPRPHPRDGDLQRQLGHRADQVTSRLDPLPQSGRVSATSRWHSRPVTPVGWSPAAPSRSARRRRRST